MHTFRHAAVLGSIFLGACASPPTLINGSVTDAVPATPDPSARYAIYLHGIGLDRPADDAVRARFSAVTRSLADAGIQVIAEVRGPGTIKKSPEDLDAYARKVASQVAALRTAGVPPRNISVIGYSRGGVIALMSAGFVAHPEVGFAILAGCVSERGAAKKFVPVLMRYAEKLDGRFLSVVEESDADFSSCEPYFERAGAKPVRSETLLRTGKGHLLFAEPVDAWVAPVTQWVHAR